MGVVRRAHHHLIHLDATPLSEALAESCSTGSPMRSSIHRIDYSGHASPAARGWPCPGCRPLRALSHEELSRSLTSASSYCCRSSGWIADGGFRTGSWGCWRSQFSFHSVAAPDVIARHAGIVRAATGLWYWRWRPRSCGR